MATRVDKETGNCRECQGGLTCMHCHPEDRPTQTLRIAELEAAIEKALRHSDANGMKDWPVFRHLRKTLGR